jgi:hypothetical protein
VRKRYFPGQIVRYIRTGAIYLLMKEVEISMLSPHFFKGTGQGFRAYVLYTGRSWSKAATEIDIFILEKSNYYEVLSDVIPPEEAA